MTRVSIAFSRAHVRAAAPGRIMGEGRIARARLGQRREREFMWQLMRLPMGVLLS